MMPSCFDYILVHLRQKAHLRPEVLSTLGQNPTRKARPDLQLCLAVLIRKAKVTYFDLIHYFNVAISLKESYKKYIGKNSQVLYHKCV